MESKALFQRNFSVVHYQVSDQLWLARAELQDDKHNVVTKLEISVPELKISAANIEFKRKPLNFCSELCLKTKELIGLPISDLGRAINKLFVGSEGCPNIRVLFDISGSSFIYSYYIQMTQEGKFDHADCLGLFSSESRNTCLSHKRTYDNYIKEK